jgi:hypothetical protein
MLLEKQSIFYTNSCTAVQADHIRSDSQFGISDEYFALDRILWSD